LLQAAQRAKKTVDVAGYAECSALTGTGLKDIFTLVRAHCTLRVAGADLCVAEHPLLEKWPFDERVVLILFAGGKRWY